MKLIVSMLLMCFLAIPGIAGAEETNVDYFKVVVNDRPLDEPVVVQNGVSLIPVRAIMEEFDAKVKWDGDSRSTLVEYNGTAIEIPVDRDFIIVNDVIVTDGINKSFIEGSLNVSLRRITEMMGFNVYWCVENEIIYISIQEDQLGSLDLPQKRLDLNNVSHEDLVQVDLICENTASNIINFRRERGQFSNVGQLQHVSGIGGELAAQLQDLFRVPYREEGIASWYGAKFHGRRTASGEAYNRHALTAAHPSLPFGTYAEVTFERTGKSIIVRINDRGPFTGGRVIDLSERAAEEIGLRPHGVGQVQIKVLETE
ncbi:hypothetical protein GGQ84_001532 [Desulfitispora alkaliphila]|uniref:septal ring lytic transglycosylase RlpA family protein n=1 Tax=Desulfitispora alkaliphila TaxID=622674 RepID=UPI003D1C563D